MSHHLLLLDIGNSGIKAGWSDGTALFDARRFATGTNEDIRRAADDILSVGSPEEIVFMSVNPPVSKPLIDLLRTHAAAALEVGTDLPRGVAIEMAEPERVGADRTTTALAAYSRYQSALVVVDFGTAITFDCVGPDGAFLGGCICPGLSMMTSALARGTALLPEVQVAPRTAFVGKNTEEAIIGGVYHGTVAMTNGILEGIAAEMEDSMIAVATGGGAETIAPSCPAIREIIPFLSLEGLLILWKLHGADS